jgi:hypothetical protein
MQIAAKRAVMSRIGTQKMSQCVKMSLFSRVGGSVLE